MKVHYINMLLFALPLYILKHNQRNHKSTTLHTQNNRSLCECELYAPANYDSDTEMKRVMENFSKQTQHRFHEYDERMKTTRQKCREQCDKEIQKIILKDKLEKELMDKFATLQTDIQSDAIPICVCEKSIADKVEKGCLRCGGLLGGGIAPGWGLVSGLGYVGWTNYVPQIAMEKGIEEGVKAGLGGLKSLPGLSELIKDSEIQSLINPANYAEKTTYFSFVEKVNTTKCAVVAKGEEIFCDFVTQVEERIVAKQVSGIADNAARMAKITKAGVLKEGSSATSSLTTAIIASVVAIVIIVLIMLIIYLILRYRRKKKMKKKLQYIKLLEE
ncbi:surface antigen [Plasmodium falciparum UGT5.1]|uniref:Surface antigen n=1 Tax=Plasmodium falciparum UGT5.1 TaxID=1237627 RepID=W7J4K4_PLAFA|nr:surface antigen [Plasmodium falciparum UGT5.1]